MCGGARAPGARCRCTCAKQTNLTATKLSPRVPYGVAELEDATNGEETSRIQLDAQ